MNPSNELEAKLRSLSLLDLESARKNAILDVVLTAAGEKHEGFLSLAAIATWFFALKFRYRFGFGALAALWIITLYLHFAIPPQEALAITTFDRAPDVSAQEVMTVMILRGRLLQNWNDIFPTRLENEEDAAEIPPHYRL